MTATAHTTEVGLLSPRRRRAGWAAPAMALAVVALLAGLWAALVLLGLPLPADGDLVEAHGPLMALGFLGTLICLERAVALGRGWAYVAPIASAVGGLAAAGHAPERIGPALLALAGLVLVAIFVVVFRIQPTTHALVMTAGAACWPVAAGLWLAGWDVGRFVPWLAGFLVLTIAAERLELSRLVGAGARERATFLAACGVVVAGLVVSAWAEPVGARLAGAGLVALAAWLASHDIARRTVRGRGVTRFMALGLLCGYGWLAVGGVLWLVAGWPSDGPAYDAMLHAVFLGFVISMVFAHAPVIVPAVLRVPLRFHRGFYLHLALLHLSLAVRLLGGDAAGNRIAWQTGGVLNETALLLFLAVTAGTVLRSRRGRVAAAGA